MWQLCCCCCFIIELWIDKDKCETITVEECNQSNKFGVKNNLSKLKTIKSSQRLRLTKRGNWRVTRLRLLKRGDRRVSCEDVESSTSLLVDV